MDGTSMETLAEAMDRLTEAGYHEHFRATPRGMRAVGTGRIYDPQSLEIEEVVRFEGLTDPADESILFALHCEVDGVAGTYAVPYGPGMDPLDANLVPRLKGRARKTGTRSVAKG